MAGDTLITLVGNLTDEPSLRFTPQGAAVASFTVASTPRKLDKATGEWSDGDPLFMRCSVWRNQAESITESLPRGTRVIVTGKLRQRSFDDREGNKRTVVEMDVDEIGPSLKFATCKVNKVTRGSDSDTSGGSQDPWGTETTPGKPAVGDDEQPPF